MNVPDETDKIDVHIGLSLDTLKRVCTVSAIGRSREECFADRAAGDGPYFCVFRIKDEYFHWNIHEWFRSCGITSDDAEILVRDFYQVMSRDLGN